MNVRKKPAQLTFRERVQQGLHFLGRLMSISLLITLLGCAGVGSVMVYQWLDKPIAIIAVEGNFQYIKQGEIQQLVAPEIEGGIVSLDLDRISGKLVMNPWVKQATVSRRWPDGIVIKVEEEQPIARWGNQGFLNSRGQILQVTDTGALHNLPLLEGPQGQEYNLMRRYRELSQLLAAGQMKIHRMKVDQIGFWTLSLVDGPELVFGQDEVIEKARRFMRVSRHLTEEQAQHMARVDLRYGNGMAVQWHPAQVAMADRSSPERIE